MDYRSWSQWIIATIIGLAAIFGIACKIAKWVKRTRAERFALRNVTVLAALEELRKGLQDIETKLGEMDKKREQVCAGDLALHNSIDRKLDIVTADLRVNVSATVTALDGLIQLGRGLDKPVNGPVLKMRDRLSDRIAEGVGEEPIAYHGR